jgi:hypothetical protein
MMSEHVPAIRHIQSRLDQPCSYPVPQAMKAGVLQPSFRDCASEGFIDGAIPKIPSPALCTLRAFKMAVKRSVSGIVRVLRAFV